MNSEELSQTVAELQKGIDVEENFRRIFDRYRTLVDRYFAGRGFSLEERDDLVQEVFLRVYRSIASYRGESSFEAWLLGVLANVRRNRLRLLHAAKRSAVEMPIDDAQESPGFEERARAALGREIEDPDEEALRQEQIDLVEHAIAELPPGMRRVLILTLHGLKYREVAAALDVSTQTVKSHLFEARRKLREALG